MADVKISGLPASTTPLAGTEVLPIVQSGATKQVSIANVTAGRTVAASKLIVGTGTEIGRVSVWTPTNADVMLGLRCAGTGTQRALYISGDNSTGEVALDVTGSAAGTLVVKTGGTTIAKFDSDWNTQISLGNIKMMTSGKGIDFSATAGTGTSELLADYEEGTWTPVLVGSTGAGTGTYTEQVGRYTKVGRQVTIQIALGWSAHTGTGNMRVSNLPFTPATGYAPPMTTVSYNLTQPANTLLGTRILLADNTIELISLAIGGGTWGGLPMDTNVDSLNITGTYFV